MACRSYTFRSDYLFLGFNGLTCRDFWQASGPKQDQPPVTAYRQAVKNTLLTAAQQVGVGVTVTSIKVVCNDPPPESGSSYRRIILTTELSPLVLSDMILVGPTAFA